MMRPIQSILRHVPALQILLPLFVLFLFRPVYIAAQDTLTIPYLPPPSVDGRITPGEWDAAAELHIAIAGSREIGVLLRHDGSTFYLAFRDFLSTGPYFPEILVDVDNAKSAQWQADDTWFHVSAQDCYYSGAYGIYEDCAVERQDWTGIPNFPSMPGALPDTIEIAIPFARLAYEPDKHALVGLALMVTDTYKSWHLWPAEADFMQPRTWSSARFAMPSTAVAPQASFGKEQAIALLPHPFVSTGEIRYYAPERTPVTMEIFDSRGRCVARFYEQTHSPGMQRFLWNGSDGSGKALANGMYHIRARIAGTIHTHSFVIQR